MRMKTDEIIAGVFKQDMRAVARAITLCENRSAAAEQIQSAVFAKTGKARVVGITGAPGAGKSTLVDQLAFTWRKSGKTVGILAVDPSSPFSGGAILGDRIRMSHVSDQDGIYIRSMATRGALGGLSNATLAALQILDAAGFDLVLIETVGVGQAEVDIARMADTCLVVLVPGMGDGVQTIKAGILEIADLFIINKADRDGADLLQKDLRLMLSLTEYQSDDWRPEILRSVATTGEGSAEIIAQIEKHASWLTTSTLGREKKQRVIESTILKLATDLTVERISRERADDFARLVQDCMAKRTDPYSAVKKLLA